MTTWSVLSDLFSRSVHRGQMSLDGDEALETVVRPAAPAPRTPEPVEPAQDDELPFDGLP